MPLGHTWGEKWTTVTKGRAENQGAVATVQGPSHGMERTEGSLMAEKDPTSSSSALRKSGHDCRQSERAIGYADRRF